MSKFNMKKLAGFLRAGEAKSLVAAEATVRKLSKIKDPTTAQKAELISANALIRRLNRKADKEVTSASRKGEQTKRNKKAKPVTLGKPMSPSKLKLEEGKPIKGLKAGGLVKKKMNKGGMPKKSHAKPGSYSKAYMMGGMAKKKK